jgi:hypothetical protein
MKKENLIALMLIPMFAWSILSIGMFFATLAGMIPMLLFINIFSVGAMAFLISVGGIMIILALSEESEKQAEASK